jgi:hypothetical protein
MDQELKVYLENLTRQVAETNSEIARLKIQLTRMETLIFTCSPVSTLPKPDKIPQTADEFRAAINAMSLFKPLE